MRISRIRVFLGAVLAAALLAHAPQAVSAESEAETRARTEARTRPIAETIEKVRNGTANRYDIEAYQSYLETQRLELEHKGLKQGLELSKSVMPQSAR